MGIFFSIDQFDVSEIQVLLIIDVNVRKFIHQVNYSQINQLCSIIELCLWTVFHCMPFITHSFCCHSNALQQLSKFHALHPEQHTQTKKRVGLTDREGCRIKSTLPLPSCVPCPITADGSSPLFWLQCSQESKVFPRIHRWTAAHWGGLWLTPDHSATKQPDSLKI